MANAAIAPILGVRLNSRKDMQTSRSQCRGFDPWIRVSLRWGLAMLIPCLLAFHSLPESHICQRPATMHSRKSPKRSPAPSKKRSSREWSLSIWLASMVVAVLSEHGLPTACRRRMDGRVSMWSIVTSIGSGHRLASLRRGARIVQ